MKMKVMVNNVLKEFIYPPMENTPSCHASTVLPLNDGSVVAAWFCGTTEGNIDFKIWVSRPENSEWSTP